MFHPYRCQFRVLSAVTGISFVLFTSAHAQDFVGTTSSDPTVQANYSSGTAPFVTGGTTATIGGLSVNNTPSGNPLVYTSALGTTTLTSGGDLRVGNDNAGASEMDVTGGNLTIATGAGATHDTLGYRSAGTLGVSGGTFTLGNNTNDIWIGNDSAGTINVSGTGALNMLDYLNIARDGNPGTINISGTGIFNAESTTATEIDSNGGTGQGTINLTGSGVFEQTGTGTIPLGAHLAVNFGTGSFGTFSLLSASTATLDGYITSGDIQVNGAADTTLTDYTVTGAAADGSQGTIQLAGVPEPATWAMLLSGALVLLGFQRFSRKSAV
jgi:hypothetical protein